MTKDLNKRIQERNKRKTIKQCAKALYMLGNLEQMSIYLDALCDAGWISDEALYAIQEEISTECACITVEEINELRKKF